MTQQLINRFQKARLSYIRSKFSQLNPMQQEAVLATEGPLLLLAGAGSGKTTVLINRIANLIRFGRASDSFDVADTVTEEDVLFLESVTESLSEFDKARAERICALDPAPAWSVLAITFTNKAANELKQRLFDMLGPEAEDIWAMTFHSACCRILRKQIERIGYSNNFTIYDASDSERIMKEIVKDMGLDEKTFPSKYVLSIISRYKDKMIGPDEMRQQVEDANDARLFTVAKAYARYQKRLKDNDALDFDDIIFHTVRLLQENEDIRIYYQRKFRYVLVDEYQDTNHAQYLLTALLAGGYENICVVGDDDQSIYRFRGATIENILSFEKQYHASRVIRLEQNYRSTQNILNAANSVIAHNVGRKGKHLWTSNNAGEPICVYEAGDETAEANYVVSTILKMSKGRGFQDFAILYRTNAQSNALEQAFRRNAIAYRIVGGMRFFDRAEIKDMLSYLCVINNRNDELRLERIVNNPPRGIGAKTIETAQRLAHAEGTSLYDVISNPASYAPLEKATGKLKAFSTLIEGLSQLLESGMSLPDFYDALIEHTGYARMLSEKGTEESKTKLENIKELKSSIHAYVQNAPTPSLSGFLEEIALYTDLEEYNQSDDAVVMMTMHSAKGLEFPHVFLVGFEDGLFPGMRAIGDMEEMEEERRLCYVAITRAKKTLTICYARQRMLYGRTNAALPSRFLREIPEDITEKKGGYYQQPYNHSNTFSYTKSVQHTTIKSPSEQQATYLKLNKGDMIHHSAFGKGMVLSVIQMGGDALAEIAFDEIGTKKLMVKTASSYMKKL